MEQDPSCDLCGDTGTMTWQQPVTGPDDALTLTEMNHPCVNGCSGWFKLPAAERGTVVDPDEETEAGNVAVANQEHRTDWSRLAPPQDH
ncbi:hypothetical protein SAMN05216188_11976 [Lentzea xinjiangensis]|uniref:Uncharacterized protein n=1 Tax=Lentzea xinjiangensis TaxID=402600 RepID=A0A1H9TV01_9PSEU|nr:hypothetical protein [Lentzea xinjiangensis]SES00747.1 hypothetical protein SAMN05216188_11976 [Lentzea xinjiangensis]